MYYAYLGLCPVELDFSMFCVPNQSVERFDFDL